MLLGREPVAVWLSQEREQTAARGDIAGPAFSRSWNGQIEFSMNAGRTRRVQHASRARQPLIAPATMCAGTFLRGICSSSIGPFNAAANSRAERPVPVTSTISCSVL